MVITTTNATIAFETSGKDDILIRKEPNGLSVAMGDGYMYTVSVKSLYVEENGKHRTCHLA